MTWSSFSRAVVYLIVLSLCLGSVYRGFSIWLQPAWLTILWINTFFAIFVIFSRNPLTSKPRSGGNGHFYRLCEHFEHNQKWLYLPAVAILVLSLLLPLLTRDYANAVFSDDLGFHAFSVILWVPVVEEVVFRGGFGLAFRDWLGPLWGGYFSALFFALAHAQPSFQSLFDEGIGLALGPFLLGLAAECIYSLGKYRLGPCIALHASCNFSAVSFSLFDRRWLDWLHLFYI